MLLYQNFDLTGLYTIAFQLLGDFWMLMGLLVLAFSPMLYLALGAYFSITRPLTDKAITRVMISINIASQVVAVVGCFTGKLPYVKVWENIILYPTS